MLYNRYVFASGTQTHTHHTRRHCHRINSTISGNSKKWRSRKRTPAHNVLCAIERRTCKLRSKFSMNWWCCSKGGIQIIFYFFGLWGTGVAQTELLHMMGYFFRSLFSCSCLLSYVAVVVFFYNFFIRILPCLFYLLDPMRCVCSHKFGKRLYVRADGRWSILFGTHSSRHRVAKRRDICAGRRASMRASLGMVVVNATIEGAFWSLFMLEVVGVRRLPSSEFAKPSETPEWC